MVGQDASKIRRQTRRVAAARLSSLARSGRSDIRLETGHLRAEAGRISLQCLLLSTELRDLGSHLGTVELEGVVRLLLPGQALAEIPQHLPDRFGCPLLGTELFNPLPPSSDDPLEGAIWVRNALKNTDVAQKVVDRGLRNLDHLIVHLILHALCMPDLRHHWGTWA